jgi:formate dehydrogenase gamma subunit
VTSCEKCHPGATARFASTPVHVVAAPKAPTIGDRVQYWVRIIYYILIPLVIGFMLFHNVIDYLKKIRSHYAKWKAKGTYLRMSLNERIQHIVLTVTFIILALSGFALRFHWELPFIGGEFNQTLRFYVHRIAGTAFIAYFLYHILWLPLSGRGRGFVRDMIPGFKDLRDLVGILAYNLGVGKKKPEFARFTYVEKMEYWALIWGALLMIATGLILWFEKEATAIFPPWIINVATLIHYYEAILATLAIIVWHFYAVFFNPDIAPMSMTWLSGTLTDEILKEEHQLEWKKWRASQESRKDGPGSG